MDQTPPGTLTLCQGSRSKINVQSCPKTGAATNAPSPKVNAPSPKWSIENGLSPQNFSSWTSTLVGRPDPLLDIDFSRPDPFLDIEFGGPRPSIPVEPCSQVRSRTCQQLQNSTLAHRKWRRKPNRNSGCEMLGGFLRIK